MRITLQNIDGSSVSIVAVRLVELTGPHTCQTATFGNGPVVHHDVASVHVEPFTFCADLELDDTRR